VCEEGCSHFEDSIVVESEVLLSQFVLPKNLDREVEGGMKIEEEGGLSLIAAGGFAELIAHLTHVGVDQDLRTIPGG
jgi:hypothetical protein